MSNEIDLDLDDSLTLDLGAEDGTQDPAQPNLTEEGDGLSLEMGGDELELSSGDDISSSDLADGGDDLGMDLSIPDDSSGLELGSADESESLDLGDGLADGGEEFSLDQLEQNDQEISLNEESLPDLNTDNVTTLDEPVDDLQFAMTESPLEEELSFSAGSPAEEESEILGDPPIEDELAAKLAEIDAMIDDAPISSNATMDKTGDISHVTIAALEQSHDEPVMQEMARAPVAPSEAANKGNRTSTHVRNQLAELDEMFTDDMKGAGSKSKTKLTDNTTTDHQRSASKEDSELIGMHGDELGRLAATISHLRDDRHNLVEKIEELERQRELDKREKLNLNSELEEKKIEISIIKKRFSQQLDEMKYNLQLMEEKKRLLEEKNNHFHKEYDRLNHRVQIDIKKVQQREKELENQLDLLKVDSETQVRNRDNKILELKRKIDSLEFDLDQISQKETRNREDRYDVEEKMDKLMKTLRSAITIIEGDEQQLKNFDFIKKNLDI